MTLRIVTQSAEDDSECVRRHIRTEAECMNRSISLGASSIDSDLLSQWLLGRACLQRFPSCIATPQEPEGLAMIDLRVAGLVGKPGMELSSYEVDCFRVAHWAAIQSARAVHSLAYLSRVMSVDSMINGTLANCFKLTEAQPEKLLISLMST